MMSIHQKQIQFMKSILLSLSLIIAGLATAQSSTSGNSKPNLTPQEKADKITAKMKTELNLTAEQETKVRQANLEFVTKNQELQRSNKEARMQNREQHKVALTAILTPQQLEKAKKIMEEKREKGKQRRERRGR